MKLRPVESEELRPAVERVDISNKPDFAKLPIFPEKSSEVLDSIVDFISDIFDSDRSPTNRTIKKVKRRIMLPKIFQFLNIIEKVSPARDVRLGASKLSRISSR